MNVFACFVLKFDAVLGEMPPDAPLQKQCEELKSSLHQRSDNVTDIYDDLASQCANQIEPKVRDRIKSVDIRKERGVSSI